MIHDEKNKFMVHLEESYVQQIAQEHKRITQNISNMEMPKFDEEEEDARDTLIMDRNEKNHKLFENVEEMIRLKEQMLKGGVDVDFEFDSLNNMSLTTAKSNPITTRDSRRNQLNLLPTSTDQTPGSGE